MILKLTTVREIPNEMLSDWIRAIKPVLFWIDEEKLREKHKQIYRSTEEIVPGILTQAETTLEVVEWREMNVKRRNKNGET